MRYGKCVQFFTMLTFFVFQYQNTLAQKQVNVLYFGSACIDFNTNPAESNLTSAMNSIESAASICDSNGVLQFYTNGGSSPSGFSNGAIWNRNHQIMDNGILIDTAGCYSSYRGALILPMPNKSNHYYLFTRDCIEHNYMASNAGNRGLTYSVIDMNQNNGLGKVIQKGVELVYFGKELRGGTGGWNEPIGAALHENKNDYWLFSYIRDTIYNLLIDSTGFHPYKLFNTGEGKIVVSPDQKYIAFGKDLYHFNHTNGNIFDKIEMEAREIEFSPNGHYIYGVINNRIYQYDLLSTDILKSKTLIATNTLNILSLAPDGIIYNFSQKANSLQYSIRCPNEPGLNCSFQNKGIDLKGRVTNNGFTNICAHYLYKDGLICNEPPTNEAFLDSSMNNYMCLLKTINNFNENKISLSFLNNWKSNYSIQIMDCSGRIINSYMNIKSNQIEMQLNEYANGVYFAKLLIDNLFECTSKIIVLK